MTESPRPADRPGAPADDPGAPEAARDSSAGRPFEAGTGAEPESVVEATREPEAGATPWIWTAAALAIGLGLFLYFTRLTGERLPTEWVLGAGRTGAGAGVAAGTSVPETWKGR